MSQAKGPRNHNDDDRQTSKSALLSSSIQGASFLILLQVGARALTFAVNQLLIRRLSPELLGISTQLELYQISVLYFARESLRVALQRQTYDAEEKTDGDNRRSVSEDGLLRAETCAGRAQTIVNLSYISVLFGIPLAIGLANLYLRSAASVARQTPWFQEALSLYGIATFCELLAEPCFIVAQHFFLYKLRAAAESAATLTKCLATCGFALLAAQKNLQVGVLPFAVGQLAYALVLLAVYLWRMWALAAGEGFSLIPRPMASRDQSQYLLSYFSRPLLSLGGSIFIQSAVKHILTQGDTLLIATLATLRDQGIYALASNYGGLVARMLFQPIEESSRNLFSKLLSTQDGNGPEKQRIHSVHLILSDIIRLYLLLGILATALGPAIAPVLLNFVAGPQWTSSGAGHALGTYCYYIPLLALNGITEAFISAVACPAELHQQSTWMFAFSLGFAAAGYLFLRLLAWGAQGLVWANVVNMSLRILWSAFFIHSYFRRHGRPLHLHNLLPTPGAVSVGIGAAAVASMIQPSFTGGFGDLLKSALLAGSSLLLVLYFERHLLYHCIDMFRCPGSTK